MGKYTLLRAKGLWRTKQFQTKDVPFFRDGVILDPTAPLAELEPTTGATLKLMNQKNGVRGSCVHHHAIGNQRLCPVRALAKRVHHIHANSGSGDDMLCTFYDHMGKGVVMDQDMNKTIKVAVADLKLES